VRSLWPFRAGGPKECCHGWSAGWRSRTTRNPWNGVPRTPSPEWAAEMDRMKNSVQQKVPLAKTDNRWLTQRLAEERALRNPCEFVRIRAVSCELVRGRANLCEFVRISAESWVAVRDGAAGLPVGARPWGWRGAGCAASGAGALLRAGARDRVPGGALCQALVRKRAGGTPWPPRAKRTVATSRAAVPPAEWVSRAFRGSARIPACGTSFPTCRGG